MEDIPKRIYVIDSSFILAQLLPDEVSEEVKKFFGKLKIEKVLLFAPLILPFEVFNGLGAAVLSKRISAKITHELGKKFLQLEIELHGINYLETLELAQKYSLSFYDASYIWLAKMNSTNLLTLDSVCVTPQCLALGKDSIEEQFLAH